MQWSYTHYKIYAQEKIRHATQQRLAAEYVKAKNANLPA